MPSQSKQTSYEQARIAVDAVVLRFTPPSLQIYLNRREREPFQGQLELPGGLLVPGETAEATLLRKVGTHIHGFEKGVVRQFYTFTDPNRDPRIRTVSIGYLTLLSGESPMAQDQDGTVQETSGVWHPLPCPSPMAFDHREIVTAGLRHLATLELAGVAALLPSAFKLNDLHALAECVYGRTIDNRNFRKSVLQRGIVTATDQVDRSGPHRPATLYRCADRFF